MDRSPRMIARSFVHAVIVSAAVLATQGASAQLLPGRPITVIVPFPPGASADATMRVLTKKVTDNIGQQFVIDNRSGGGGSLSALALKQAAPDGHTLLEMVVGTHALNQSLGAEYDVRKDFAPITQLWNLPLLLVVPDTLGVNSVADLIALARTRPQGLNYASTAINSAGHILGSLLAKASGIPAVHVPYRGAAPAMTDLVAGRIDFYFVSYASVSSFVEAGKLKVLAAGSATRLKALPDVPTMAEAGFPTVEFGAQFGLAAPAGTPTPTIGKLNQAFVAAASDPEIVSRMAGQGVEIVTSSPDHFKSVIDAEFEKLARILPAVGAKAP
jgi:tripartite-type tricarboxylate transporter receptor subunit TctC